MYRVRAYSVAAPSSGSEAVLAPVVRSSTRSPVSGWDGTSVGMGVGSARRMRRLLRLTRHVRVDYMVTLTLPGEWSLESYRAAKRVLLERMRHLRRTGRVRGYVWWVEFQQRGAPHIHVYVRSSLHWYVLLRDLSRVWGFVNPAPNAVDIQRLQRRGMRYLAKYARKLSQKRAPYRARWGQWWRALGDLSLVVDEYCVPDASQARLDLLRMGFDRSTWSSYGVEWYTAVDPPGSDRR